MIKIIENQLEGKFASPKDHPITCANPKPWKIEEMRIEFGWDRTSEEMMWKIWIRNKNSIWFRANQCWIDSQEQLLNELSSQMVKS